MARWFWRGVEFDGGHDFVDRDAERGGDDAELAGVERTLAAQLVRQRGLADAEDVLSEVCLLDAATPEFLVNRLAELLVEGPTRCVGLADVCSHVEHDTTYATHATTLVTVVDFYFAPS
ncbi:hypothetical protein [Mycolicibacterium sp. XJ1819]